MIPLIIGGVFLAGYLWIIKLTEPNSPKHWYDQREFEKFMRERERLSKSANFWNLLQ